MIGEEQAKGYPNEPLLASEEEESETQEVPEEKFEEAKKKALMSIGRYEEAGVKPEDIPKQIRSDPITEMQTKINKIDHDLSLMKMQVNEAVNVLNKLQIGFVSKLGEMQGKLEAKIEALKVK